MKFINIASTLLFTATVHGATISKEFDEQVELSLRRTDRNVPGTPEEWLDALNEAREIGQETLLAEYTPFEWSPDLANEAQGWANGLAASCTNGVPAGEENPGDYGVTTILNMRNPGLAVERWMINGESIIDAACHYPRN
jgi:hypothetical protein